MSDQPPVSDDQTPPSDVKPSKKKRRRSWLTWFMSVAFTLLLIGGIGAAVAVGWFRSAVTAPGPHMAEVVVDIPRGAGVRGIANLLTEQGVLSDPMVFFLQVRLADAARSLKAGEMAFPAQAPVKQVIEILQEGRTVQYTLTIPEGLTSTQAIALIAQHPKLVGDIDRIPPEGALLPETYAFPRGYRRAQLVTDMQDAMQDFLLVAWQSRQADLPLSTPLEAVTLASIVEKETGQADERDVVAGVFVNRLNRGMRLQSDPTVIYGLVGGAGDLGRELFRSDWRSDTPYNTYVINGLPPGPIANPGKRAIQAALQPATTDYIYFVADGTGGHAFAETLDQHNANVARWRAFKRQQQQ